MAPPPAELVLGVDLGTTNSVIAVFREDGVEVVPNDIGGRTTPSCVCFEDGRLVGEAALRMAVSAPTSTVRGVKSILGVPFSPDRPRLNSVELKCPKDSTINLKINSALYASEEVAGLLLMELKKAAEGNLGVEVKKAVIAVPSYFNASQRCAVQNSAFLAGLEVQQLVNETTAAALAFAHDREGPKKVVILDVGGGGGSVAVAQVDDSAVAVLSHSCGKLPGGEAFDAKMIEFLKQAAGKEALDPRGSEILRTQWEQAKQKLSRIPKATISAFLPGSEAEFRKDVKRSDFEEHCEDLFQCITMELITTLKMAKVKPEEVDDVVLVGGSTRIPRLRKLVQEALGGKTLCKAVNPDEAVALGAALLGAGQVRLQQERLALLTVVNCGTQMSQQWTKNEPLPVSMTTRFGGKAVVIKQGESNTTVRTVLNASVPTGLRVSECQVTLGGTVMFFNSNGAPVQCYMTECSSEKALKELAKKIKNYAKTEEAEVLRLQSKNECEDILRQVVSYKIDETSCCQSEAKDLNEFCIKKLDWLKKHGGANRVDFDKLREDVKERFGLLQVKLKEEQDLAVAKQMLLEVLESVLQAEVSADELCPEPALALREACQRVKSTLLKSRNVTKETCDSTRVKIEEKKAGVEALRQAERERRQAYEKAKSVVYSLLQKWQKTADDIFREVAEFCSCTLRKLKTHPSISTDECKRLVDEVNSRSEAAEEERRQAIAEQQRVDARNGLKARVTELTAIKKANGDDNQAGHDYRARIQRLCQEEQDWLHTHDAATEAEFARRLQCLDEKHSKFKGEYEDAKRALKEATVRTRTILEEKIRSILNSEIPDNHEARVAARALQEKCRQKQLLLMVHRNISKPTLESCLEEITKLERDVEQKNRDERERKTLLNVLRTGLHEVRQKYNGEHDVCSICDRVEAWLDSHSKPCAEELKFISVEIEKAMEHFEESLRQHEVASRGAGAAQLARQQFHMICESLQMKMGLPAAAVQASAPSGHSRPEAYSAADFTQQAAEPMDTNENGDGKLLAPEALDRILDLSRWQVDPSQTERLHQLAEAHAVEALREADASGCLALMVYKTVAAERERLSLSTRYMQAVGVPVERVLLVRAVLDPSQPQGGPSCARRLAEAFRQLCQRAGVQFENILTGVSTVGAGPEGEAFREELVMNVPGLEDGAVSLGQRLVSAANERRLDAPAYSPKRLLCDFFDTLDVLRSMFSVGAEQFQLLKARCSSLKSGNDPWTTYESTVRFLVDEQTAGVRSALREVAAMWPTNKKLADVIAVEMGRSDFTMCLATCYVFFKETERFANFVDKLDTVTLPERNIITGSSLRGKEELLFTRTKTKINAFHWDLYLQDKVTRLVSLCVDLLEGIMENYVNGLQERILLLEEMCSLKGRTRPYWTSSLKILSEQVIADFDVFKANNPSNRIVSLQAMASSMPREEFRRQLPDLHRVLVRALTAPLTAPACPRSWDQLRQGGRFASSCNCPEDVAEAVILLAAHAQYQG